MASGARLFGWQPFASGGVLAASGGGGGGGAGSESLRPVECALAADIKCAEAS